MLSRFKIDVNGEIDADQVLMNNGYERKHIEDVFSDWRTAFNLILSEGECLRNDCFIKGDSIVIFSNWESDENGIIKRNPTYIEVVDITHMRGLCN